MRQRTFFGVVFSFLIAVPLFALEDAERDALLDPIPVRDQFLLSNGFFFFEPESARVLLAGESTFDMHFAESNTFAKSNWITRSLVGDTSRMSGAAALAQPRYSYVTSMFLVDGSTHRMTLSYRRGIGSNLQLGIAIPVGMIGGGWSDGAVEATHRALRIGNDVRDALQRNREVVYLRSGSTTYFRDHSDGAALGDIALTAKYELPALEDPGLAMAVMAAVELPTGDAGALYGSGSLDGGVQLMLTRDLRYARLHASLGLLRLGANRPLGTPSQIIISDTIGASRLLTERTAAVAQITISESPFRTLGMRELRRRSYQLTLGARHAWPGGIVVYGGLIENVATFENGADAAMQWGISKRF